VSASASTAPRVRLIFSALVRVLLVASQRHPDTFTSPRGLLISTRYLRLVDVCNIRSGSVVVE
jgi:hypothetical protein